MNRPLSSKVAIDTEVAQKIPTVYVTAPTPPVNNKRKEDEDKPLGIKDLFVSYLRSLINFFFDFLETTVVALSIFVVAYLFLIQPHEIKGNSMEPNFHNNEYILTDKITYRFAEPTRGDVIIFKAPKNPEVDYIKRIIGLPAERVKIQNSSVYVNGRILNEPYVKDPTTLSLGNYMQEGVEIVVPPDEYLVLGDNRPHSSDSREFGPVPAKLIIGKAVLRYWPLPELGLLPKVGY